MEEQLSKQMVNISGALHSFIKRKAAEPENKGETIGSLIEHSIMETYGVDENGEPILVKKSRRPRIKLAKE